MRIILDECVPNIVKRALPDRNIVTVQEMGWGGIKNGKLLKLISQEFDVFITSDKNLKHQQNLDGLNISIVVLPSNQVPVVKRLVPTIDEALANVSPPELVEISDTLPS